MIEVEGLTKQYKSVRAVDDLTFKVEPGIVTGFLGPNGAGKSTTMRMILGLDSPTAGQARINGKTYRELKNPLREVGALLDAKAVHPNRTAANHLKWMAQSNGIPTKRVEEVLGLVGLSDVAGKRPAASLSVWASASAWQVPCWVTRESSSSTSRLTASTQKAFAGCAPWCAHSQLRAVPC